MVKIVWYRMLIAQLFLVASISVANAKVIVDSEVQSHSAALQVECGDKTCKNNATCKTGNICDCKRGTKGDECEVVIGCDTLKKECDKINTECIYNPYKWSATCKCNDEKKKFNGWACVDCDCGEHARRCDFSESGRKACFCEKGYAHKIDTCSPCSCGAPEGEKACVFTEGVEFCICKEGYGKKNQICTECSCGPQTQSCGFDTGKKYCICNEGYKFKLGTCSECNCGENSTYCYFKEGTSDKQCSCTDGNADKLGTCTHCDCGPDTSCSFDSSGEKKCVCLGKLCEEPPIPWFKNPVVIVCIVALVGIVAFIGGFVAYRKLRRN